MKILGTRWAT